MCDTNNEDYIDPPEIRDLCLICPRKQCNNCIELKTTTIQKWFKPNKIKPLIEQGLTAEEAAIATHESIWLMQQYYQLYIERTAAVLEAQ